MVQRGFYLSPIGGIWIEEEEEHIVGIFLGKKEAHPILEESTLLKEAKKQLEEYFYGKREKFCLPLNPKGTTFQKKVWEALQAIPYGQTRSYKELAKRVGSPKAYRAVGGANHRNQILIVIPCHRVIGANGELVGFGSGVEIKKYLLELEMRNLKEL